MNRLADPFGLMRAGRLDQLLGSIQLNGPTPTKMRGSRFAWEIVRARLGAEIPSPLEPAQSALFGIPVQIVDDLAIDEVRIDMSDGTERVYKVGPA